MTRKFEKRCLHRLAAIASSKYQSKFNFFKLNISKTIGWELMLFRQKTKNKKQKKTKKQKKKVRSFNSIQLFFYFIISTSLLLLTEWLNYLKPSEGTRHTHRQGGSVGEFAVCLVRSTTRIDTKLGHNANFTCWNLLLLFLLPKNSLYNTFFNACLMCLRENHPYKISLWSELKIIGKLL